MSANEFAGLEFAIGTVRGFRSWNVTVDGRLQALHQTGIWTPGENVAECLGSPSKDVIPPIEGEDWKERQAKVDEWRSNHEMVECQHGFYAYFSSAHIQAGYRPAVHGVIEGYGEVLIGTKGFRAAKSRILAISVEPFEGIWNLDSFVTDKIRRNYPGVPIFESNFAMQSDFPVVNGLIDEGVTS